MGEITLLGLGQNYRNSNLSLITLKIVLSQICETKFASEIKQVDRTGYHF